MFGIIKRYVRWLHTGWPAGTVEKLPSVQEDGSTNVPGLYIVGDLTGIPLLKFSSDSGARAVQTILADANFQKRAPSDDTLDILIVGAGVSGMAAAIEAKKAGLRFTLLEASEPLSTIVNFPKGKPIYTYPTDMTPQGDLQFTADVKEGLVDEINEQVRSAGIEPRIARVERITRKGNLLEASIPDGEPLRAHRVIVAIGRSGNYRKLGVPGEEHDKVSNRLHDPKEYKGKHVLVVGGGDSALETAIAITQGGGHVTLSYRKPSFSRPKPDNIDKVNQLIENPRADVRIESPSSEKIGTSSGMFLGLQEIPGSLKLMLGSKVKQILDDKVVLIDQDGDEKTQPNDAVFAMIGREAPLDFFRRSGVKIHGEWGVSGWLSLIAFFAFCFWLYHWKKYGAKLGFLDLDPSLMWNAIAAQAKTYFNDPKTLGGTLKISASGRSFYYTLTYAICVVVFGIRRIRRRKTPYVTLQTISLMAIQVFPLFLLPEIIFPLMGHNGWFDSGIMKWFADTFMPVVNYGHKREYWRSYGFILAWPLMAWNWFTHQPLWGWLILGFIQTFVLLPGLIYFYGKGVYCGWICSCGALAETLGDAHRHKMPHGPFWNRLNMVGQVFLFFALALMLLRILGWMNIAWASSSYKVLSSGVPVLNYGYMVDLMWAGIIGVGLYFHFSGRVWCRFACPLAALMHIYGRFSRFRIVADKKKCISCNVCTSVCHQGIDIMNFANKGIPMEDPECVRCSACVQSCPTGVLQFGQVNRKTGEVIKLDKLAASPVLMAERADNAVKQTRVMGLSNTFIDFAPPTFLKQAALKDPQTKDTIPQATVKDPQHKDTTLDPQSGTVDPNILNSPEYPFAPDDDD